MLPHSWTSLSPPPTPPLGCKELSPEGKNLLLVLASFPMPVRREVLLVTVLQWHWLMEDWSWHVPWHDLSRGERMPWITHWPLKLHLEMVHITFIHILLAKHGIWPHITSQRLKKYNSTWTQKGNDWKYLVSSTLMSWIIHVSKS